MTASLAVMLTALACGARSMLEPESESDPLARAGAGGSPTVAPSGGGSAGLALPPSSFPPPASQEPDAPCAVPVLRARTPLADCPFIEDGLCHETAQCACASACSPGEQCVFSGFLDPDEPQTITCVDLR
jgi:hypothetical protein